jgi:hypothetical protein
MADEIDRAQETEEAHRDAALAKFKSFCLPSGEKGDCEYCGEWSGRLVSGACARCRDFYKLR